MAAPWQTRHVDFSRHMGVSSLASLAAVVGTGILGYAAAGTILLQSGSDAPIKLAIAGIAFVPIILCLVSRASESHRGGTCYEMARRSGSSSQLFAVGWLALGGYLALGGLMVEALAVRVGTALDVFLDLDVPLIVLVAPITVVAGLAESVLPFERSRVRSLMGWIALAIIGLLCVRFALDPPPPVPDVSIETTPPRHWLSSVSLAAASLWLVEIVLDYRRQFRRSDGVLAAIITGAWLLAVGLTITISIILWKHPEYFARLDVLSQPSAAWQQTKILGIFVMFTLCGTVLVKAMTRILRLAGAMALDGMLPAFLERAESKGRLPSLILVLLAVVVMALAAWVDHRLLASVAGISFLWIAFLVIANGLTNSDFRNKARFRLRLHPVLPLLALVSSGFFSLVASREGLAITGTWLVVGFLGFRVLRDRSGKLLGAAEAERTADEPTLTEGVAHRVLVGLGPASNVEALMDLGARIAQAHGGDLIVLEVEPLLEQLPRAEVRRAAGRQWEALDRLLHETVPDDVDASSLVRIAPTVEAGILEAASRHAPELMLLDLPEGDDGPATEHAIMVRGILNHSRHPVAVLRGKPPERQLPWRLLAGTSGGPDSTLALSVGDALARGTGGVLTALHVHPPLQADDEAEQTLKDAVDESGVPAQPLVLADIDVSSGIAAEAEHHDLLIVGSTRDRVSNRTGLAGLWQEIAARWPGPMIMVRRPDKVQARLASRLWNIAYLGLPTLSVPEQAEVYAEMRHSAGASKDFFALIVIASAIATFGLLQNSAAVIIGAMLVAPLMSPIVAIAQGIVQGNLVLIRRSVTSTFKGTTVSVGVAFVIVMLTPELSATAQILARTRPTLLDLGVGLAAGAAAAYGVSRKSVAAALPGVAISVALVPPLCVVGYGLGTDQFDVAFGSLVLFLTNLTAIVLVSVLVFLLLGFMPRAAERRGHVRTAMLLNALALGVLCIPLGISSYHTTRANQVEVAIEEALRSRALERDFHLEAIDVTQDEDLYTISATVLASIDVTSKAISELRAEIEDAIGIRARLELFVVRAERITEDIREATSEPEEG